MSMQMPPMNDIANLPNVAIPAPQAPAQFAPQTTDATYQAAAHTGVLPPSAPIDAPMAAPPVQQFAPPAAPMPQAPPPMAPPVAPMAPQAPQAPQAAPLPQAPPMAAPVEQQAPAALPPQPVAPALPAAPAPVQAEAQAPDAGEEFTGQKATDLRNRITTGEYDQQLDYILSIDTRNTVVAAIEKRKAKLAEAGAQPATPAAQPAIQAVNAPLTDTRSVEVVLIGVPVEKLQAVLAVL